VSQQYLLNIHRMVNSGQYVHVLMSGCDEHGTVKFDCEIPPLNTIADVMKICSNWRVLFAFSLFIVRSSHQCLLFYN
jgi:hypothetical protein